MGLFAGVNVVEGKGQWVRLPFWFWAIRVEDRVGQVAWVVAVWGSRDVSICLNDYCLGREFSAT